MFAHKLLVNTLCEMLLCLFPHHNNFILAFVVLTKTFKCILQNQNQSLFILIGYTFGAQLLFLSLEMYYVVIMFFNEYRCFELIYWIFWKQNQLFRKADFVGSILSIMWIISLLEITAYISIVLDPYLFLKHSLLNIMFLSTLRELFILVLFPF